MVRMKILVDNRASQTEEHARRMLRAREVAESNTRNAMHIVPRGVAVHRAQYPSTCDECGESYWSADEYASHIRCPGPPKAQAGFHARRGDV